MARSTGNAKPKLTRAEKKAARSASWEQRKQTFASMKQAFTLTRQQDAKFLPYLVIAGVLGAAVGYLVPYFLTSSLYVPIPVAVLVAVLAMMIVFSRRAQTAMYSQAEGQPGVAGWMLQQQLKGEWRLEQGVAGTTQLDAVHRLVGRPGIVLVGEGAPHRVKPLLAQERKKLARITGDTPIYDVIVGTGEDELQLSKVQRYLLKLPRNLSSEEVSGLNRRLSALGGARQAVPQGPMPQGAKVRNVQRTVRRRS